MNNTSSDPKNMTLNMDIGGSNIILVVFKKIPQNFRKWLHFSHFLSASRTHILIKLEESG
jgi:hypothetical protein